MDERAAGEGRPHLLPLVDRKLGAHRERLVPLARGDERVDLAEEGELPVAIADAAALREPVTDGVDGLGIAVELCQLVGEVVRRPQAGRGLVVLDRRPDGEPEEGEGLLPSAVALQDHGLRRERLDEHLRQLEVSRPSRARPRSVAGRDRTGPRRRGTGRAARPARRGRRRARPARAARTTGSCARGRPRSVRDPTAPRRGGPRPWRPHASPPIPRRARSRARSRPWRPRRARRSAPPCRRARTALP